MEVSLSNYDGTYARVRNFTGTYLQSWGGGGANESVTEGTLTVMANNE